MKKPPDIYKTYKNSFSKIIKDDYLEGRINDAMERTNKITTRTYLFLRLYLLKCFNNEYIFNQSNKLNESILDGIIRIFIQLFVKKDKEKEEMLVKNLLIFMKMNIYHYKNKHI